MNDCTNDPLYKQAVWLARANPSLTAIEMATHFGIDSERAYDLLLNIQTALHSATENNEILRENMDMGIHDNLLSAEDLRLVLLTDHPVLAMTGVGCGAGCLLDAAVDSVTKLQLEPLYDRKAIKTVLILTFSGQVFSGKDIGKTFDYYRTSFLLDGNDVSVYMNSVVRSKYVGRALVTTMVS